MTPREKLTQEIHAQVNQYPYATDDETHGLPEFWEPISAAGKGDCEDFVLEKRSRLMAAGVPPQDLRIGVVNLPTGGSHAVLVVRDGDHDLVADQTRPFLMSADEMRGLGYAGDRIQVPGRFMWDKWEI